MFLRSCNINFYFKVESVELPFDKVKNQRRQFCFVTFEDEMTVDQVCKQPKQKIGNKECDVKKATTKPDPRLARGGAMGARGRGRGKRFFTHLNYANTFPTICKLLSAHPKK